MSDLGQKPLEGFSRSSGSTACNNSDDQFDPFLPSFEATVEEQSLQSSMDINRESLKRKLLLRRSMAELADQGIYPPLKTPPAFAEQRKHLERAKAQDLLRKKLTTRPDRQCLVQHHILEDMNPMFDRSVKECERQQKRSRLQEMLTDHLVHRPGPLDLVSANILKVDPDLQSSYGYDDGTLFLNTAESGDACDLWPNIEDPDNWPVFADSFESITQDSPTSGLVNSADLSSLCLDSTQPDTLLLSFSTSSFDLPSSQTFMTKDISHKTPVPKAPDITPLLSSSVKVNRDITDVVSRVPTPPDITPFLEGGVKVPATFSFAHTAVSFSSTSAITSASIPSKSQIALSSQRGSVTKKSRSKIAMKSKVIKFHEYHGPPGSQRNHQGAKSSDIDKSAANASFIIMREQQQLLLQWQLQQLNKTLVTHNDDQSTESSPTSQPFLGVNAAVASAKMCLTSTNRPVRLEDMKVADLKEACRRHNLSRSGPKPTLIERLMPYASEVLSHAIISEQSSFAVDKPCATASTPISQPLVPMDVDGVCKSEPTTPVTSTGITQQYSPTFVNHPVDSLHSFPCIQPTLAVNNRHITAVSMTSNVNVDTMPQPQLPHIALPTIGMAVQPPRAAVAIISQPPRSAVAVASQLPVVPVSIATQASITVPLQPSHASVAAIPQLPRATVSVPQQISLPMTSQLPSETVALPPQLPHVSFTIQPQLPNGSVGMVPPQSPVFNSSNIALVARSPGGTQHISMMPRPSRVVLPPNMNTVSLGTRPELPAANVIQSLPVAQAISLGDNKTIPAVPLVSHVPIVYVPDARMQNVTPKSAYPAVLPNGLQPMPNSVIVTSTNTTTARPMVICNAPSTNIHPAKREPFIAASNSVTVNNQYRPPEQLVIQQQQQQIIELKRHLEQSQRELARAQREARLRQLTNLDEASRSTSQNWPKTVCPSSSLTSDMVSSATMTVQTPATISELMLRLNRTSPQLPMSSSDPNLRCSVTSHGLNELSMRPTSFSHLSTSTSPTLDGNAMNCMARSSSSSIEDVLQVLINSGEMPCNTSNGAIVASGINNNNRPAFFLPDLGASGNVVSDILSLTGGDSSMDWSESSLPQRQTTAVGMTAVHVMDCDTRTDGSNTCDWLDEILTQPNVQTDSTLPTALNFDLSDFETMPIDNYYIQLATSK